MKKFFVFALMSILLFPLQADEWIRINQLGYLPQSIKVAVFMSEEGNELNEFQLVDAYTKQVVKTSNPIFYAFYQKYPPTGISPAHQYPRQS